MGKAGEAEGMWEVSFHFLASPSPKREIIASSLIPAPRSPSWGHHHTLIPLVTHPLLTWGDGVPLVDPSDSSRPRAAATAVPSLLLFVSCPWNGAGGKGAASCTPGAGSPSEPGLSCSL